MRALYNIQGLSNCFEATVRYLEKLLKAMWIFFLLKDSTGRRVLDISLKR